MKGKNNTDHCKFCGCNCLKNSKLSDSELDLLNQNKCEITYNKGETIFKQGTFVSNIIYLKQGLIKLIIEGSNSKNIIVKFVASGQFIDFSAFNSEDCYSYTAIAVKNSDLCLIKKETIHELKATNHNLCQSIIAWCGEDYHKLYEKLSMLGTKNMHGKLAETILYMCQEEFSKEGIFNHTNRRDIAELAGMSSESMIKLLQELKADNIIAIDGKNIEIRDHEMLTRLSKIG